MTSPFIPPEEVRAIRQDNGLSIDGMCKLLRIKDERTVRRWESGEVPITGPASIILELLDAGELPARFMPGRSDEIMGAGQ